MAELVTVVVPVYRVEQYLDECIQSLVNQTHWQLEIVLVDDGSPDRSGQMCDLWAARDSRIRVIHRPNGGPSCARNAGLDTARGEYVTFVDADDVISPELVEHSLELARRERVEIVTLRLVPFGDSKPLYTESDDFVIRPVDEELARMGRSGAGWDTCGKLYRSELFSGPIRFTEGILYEDLEFAPRIFAATDRVLVSDSALYGYRQHPHSIMGKSRTAVSPDLIRVLRANTDLARHRHGTDATAFTELQTAYVLHASKQLERMDSLRAWWGGRAYRREYVSFVKDNWSGVRGSGALSPLYLGMLRWSCYSPTGFVALSQLAYVFKRRLVPGLRRRSRALPQMREDR